MTSPSLLITPATFLEDLQAVKSLLVAYGELRKHDAALGDYEHEINNLPGAYGPPTGCLLLARWEDKAAGCVAYRDIGEGRCEMKRLFVLPEFQGKGIGRALVEHILQASEKAGYRVMRLDTHPWMEQARKLYLEFGFEEIEAYRYNPTPGIRFFERNA